MTKAAARNRLRSYRLFISNKEEKIINSQINAGQTENAMRYLDKLLFKFENKKG